MTDNKGISQLLEAEKEAAKVVAKARSYRIAKLKDAKLEAQKEIEQLKASKEKEFQEFMAKQNSAETFKKVDKEMEERLLVIAGAFKQNKEKALEKVLSTVAPSVVV
eukprot:Partr_v1_DN28415_c1_g1_i1_m41096 putative ATPase, H transporting, lysosomal 13kDa, V1 subunit